MLKSTQIVSVAEKALVSAVEALKYGEIIDIDVDLTDPSIMVKLTEKQSALISFVRDGHSHIDRLIVHEGEPVQVECDLRLHGYKCVRKLRL